MTTSRTLGLALAGCLALAAGLALAQPADTFRWVSYRDFWFDFDSARIDSADGIKVADVASYAKSNPTHRIGLDGMSGGEEAELDARRIGAIRDALIKAGVPAQKIYTGAFGDARFRRGRRVEVLVDRHE